MSEINLAKQMIEHMIEKSAVYKKLYTADKKSETTNLIIEGKYNTLCCILSKLGISLPLIDRDDDNEILIVGYEYTHTLCELYSTSKIDDVDDELTKIFLKSLMKK